MKLQLKILINVIKSLITVNLFFCLSLIVYFLIFIVFNQYDFTYYKYIFGITNSNDHFAILLLLLNISYLVIWVYKYLNYEIVNFPFQIVLRENSKTWIIQKTIYIVVIVFLYKIIQYVLFGILYCQFFREMPLSISFYFNNILFYIIVSFTVIIITCSKTIFKFLSLLLILLYLFSNINIYVKIFITILLLIRIIVKFNFKQVIYKY